MKGIRKRIYISIGDFVLLFFILISFVFSPIGKIFLPFFSLIQYMIIAYTLLLSYYFFYLWVYVVSFCTIYLSILKLHMAKSVV